MMLKLLQKRAWISVTSVLISIGKAPNALLLEHSLVAASVVAS